jgi:pimeloyl-ACP methyl ester carboxylesterase
MRTAVDVAGLKVAYQEVGVGPVLLLFHGGMSDSREWRYQLAELADATAAALPGERGGHRRTPVAWSG